MSLGISALQKKNLTVFKHLSDTVFRILVDTLNDPTTKQAVPPRFHRTLRFPMGIPEREDIDLPTFDFIDGLLQAMHDEQISYFDSPRSDQSYYLLLVGAPSENVLIDSIRNLKPKCLMIGIGDIHQFTSTLDTIDWGRHIVEFQKSGGTVYLIAESDPTLIVENAWRTCRIHNPTQIDNFTAIIHGNVETQQQVGQHIAQTLMLSITQLGFFHDECVMLWNAYQNRKTGKVSVFHHSTSSISGTAAFVVASGPSLENNLNVIKKHQGQAIVISVASALRPLLDAGITPDFHVELENVYITPKLIELSKDHDLSDIRLVAATTVEPDVLNYFNHAILYSREALSPYPLFSTGLNETLSLPGPTAGNAALSFALESGFEDVYLFGLDLGTHDPNLHHTRGSYYDTDDALAHPDEYNISVPGNFADTVWTSRAFLSALKNADDLAAQFRDRARISNCSDGALLAHVKPLCAEEISTDFSMDKTRLITALYSQFDDIPPNATNWPGGTLCAAIQMLFEQLRSTLSDSEALADGSYETKLIDILKLPIGYRDAPHLGADMSALMLVRGTVLAMTLFMERYRNRVTSADMLGTFADVAAKHYINMLEELESTAMRLFEGQEPNQPPPVEARIASPDRVFPPRPRIPRNADCPCGSGEKFKRCHGKVS